MFLFFAFSATQVANTTTNASNAAAGVSSAPNTSNLLYVALAFGFSLTVNAWVFFRLGRFNHHNSKCMLIWHSITGGLFNPAVSKAHTYHLSACVR